MGTAESHFAEQITHFQDKFDLILIDLPGHGKSIQPASATYFEDCLDWLLNHLKNNGEGFCVRSFFGCIVSDLANKAPHLVKGIILTGYSPYIPQDLKAQMAEQYNYFITIEKNDQSVAKQFRHTHGEKWLDTLKKVLHTMTYDYPEISKEDLNRLQSPALILNGSKDNHEVEAITYLNRQNCSIATGLIPLAGHTANMDQPEIFNCIVSKYLDNISGN